MKGGRWRAGLVLAFTCAVAGASAGPKQRAALKLQPLQQGITLPVQLGSTLRAGKVKPGTVVVTTTTQRVPVSEQTYLNRGVKLRGDVVTSTVGDGTAGHPSILTIRFTQMSYRGQMVPVATRAVAIASFVEVADTAIPVSAGGTGRGNLDEANWTTRQVGGDEVCRAGWVGDVIDSTSHTVGFADYDGVYSLPAPVGGADGVRLPRAVGVFSTTAKGLFGFEQGARLESSSGLITVTSPEKGLVIRRGDNLLLEVVAEP